MKKSLFLFLLLTFSFFLFINSANGAILNPGESCKTGDNCCEACKAHYSEALVKGKPINYLCDMTSNSDQCGGDCLSSQYQNWYYAGDQGCGWFGDCWCFVCQCTTECCGEKICSSVPYGDCIDACKNLGGTCVSNSQCCSGFCVDGFCCDSACNGLCEECAGIGYLGVPGYCSPVPAGFDPANECAGNLACDGNRACQTACQPKGAVCSSNDDCCATAPWCSQGVCCDRYCVGGCELCNLSGSLGTCIDVPAGQDPTNSCGSGACKGTCTGNGTCGNYPSGIPCGDGGTCNGSGQCEEPCTPKYQCCGPNTACSGKSISGTTGCNGTCCDGSCTSECKTAGESCNFTDQICCSGYKCFQGICDRNNCPSSECGYANFAKCACGESFTDDNHSFCCAAESYVSATRDDCLSHCSLLGPAEPLPPGKLNLTYPSFTIGDTTYTLDFNMPLNRLIAWFYYFIIMLSGLAAFVMLVWGGFGWLTSVGNPSKISEAKERITSALLGLLIILASWLVLRVINPDLLTLTLPQI